MSLCKTFELRICERSIFFALSVAIIIFCPRACFMLVSISLFMLICDVYLIIFVLTCGWFILFSFIASHASLRSASSFPSDVIISSQKPE